MDTDVVNANPAIDVETLVSVDGGITFFDADIAAGPTLHQTTNPIFKFVVKNTGNVALTNIKLTNSQFALDGFGNDAVVGDGAYTIATLAPDALFSIDFNTATWQAGQQTNTATVSAIFNDVTVSDRDDANYFGQAIIPLGIRSANVWSQSSWRFFWDGISGNETRAGMRGFPTGDLLLPPYTNNANVPTALKALAGYAPGTVFDPVANSWQKGLLIGDLNRNGTTDIGENTIFYTTAQVGQIISPIYRIQQDTRFTLGRSLVASWLNYLAGNPIASALEQGIQWLQALTPDENGDNKGDGYIRGLSGVESAYSPAIASGSTAWNESILTMGLPSPYSGNIGINATSINAGYAIHTALDYYNSGLGR
jgi:hypothetical protein